MKTYHPEPTCQRFPSDVFYCPTDRSQKGEPKHPTRKPVDLGRYLVRLYTNPGDLVLDNACGGGSFLIAAKEEGRRYLGMEAEAKYVAQAEARLERVEPRPAPKPEPWLLYPVADSLKLPEQLP